MDHLLSAEVVNAACCFILGFLRLRGVTNDFFKDIAHVYVGGLFTGGWMLRETNNVFLALAVLLTCLEVVAAVSFKKGWLKK